MTEGLFPPKDTPHDAFFYAVNQRSNVTFVLQWKLPPDSVGMWRTHTGIDFHPASEFADGFVLRLRIPEADELQALLAKPPAPPPILAGDGHALLHKIETVLDSALPDYELRSRDAWLAARDIVEALGGEWPDTLWPAVITAMREERDAALKLAKQATEDRRRHAARALDWQQSFAALELQHQERMTELHRVIDREVARRRQAEADRNELQNILSDWRHALAVIAAQPRKAMHLRRSTAERFWSMRRALVECRRVFLLYADLHRAKGTPEANEKADRNATLAGMCKDALRGEAA